MGARLRRGPESCLEEKSPWHAAEAEEPVGTQREKGHVWPSTRQWTRCGLDKHH